MPKMTTIFRCQQCGATSPKWVGKCSSCNAWNSLVEEVEEKRLKGGKAERRQAGMVGQSRVVKLSQVNEEQDNALRNSTGSSEFDRVLGGGMVKGSVVLIAGEPGVGKSTLLTQLALAVGKKKNNQGEWILNQVQDDEKVLYVCGEESPSQVALRVKRLDKQTANESILMLAEMDVDQIIMEAENLKPDLMIVDSIQTLTTSDLEGMAGSVGQVRECALRLIEMSKRVGITTFIVGHVTKEGTIAGPKVLEHMVDVVVELTGDSDREWRLLKTHKNRFGATDEVGIFNMSEKGMEDVANASGIFMEEMQSGVPGSAVAVLMEGTRAMLIEVQALVVETTLAMPRRVVQGVPLAKLQVLAGVLQKRCGMSLGERDIFVNIAGGLKVDEPGADLAVAMAIASSYYNKPVPKGMALVGEVGLLGEIRKVPFIKKRLSTAAKMGFDQVLSSESTSRVGEAVKKLKE